VNVLFQSLGFGMALALAAGPAGRAKAPGGDLRQRMLARTAGISLLLI
jgi:hypothetical protein